MTDHTNIEGLIADVEEAVAEGLAYFAGIDYGSRPDAEWVLRHMPFWHRASVEGMESVLAGGAPFRIPGTVDEVNDMAVADTAGLTPAEMVEVLKGLQARMVAAARRFADPEVTVLVVHDGTERSASQRLRMIAFHWKEHLSELRP